MVGRGSFLSVVDNSGARVVQCIGIPGTGNPKCAYTGDQITVTVKSLRKSAVALLSATHPGGKGGKTKKGVVRVTKGRVVKALIVRVKKEPSSACGFSDNAVVLRSAKGGLRGSRRTGPRASVPLYRKKQWKVVARGTHLLDR